MLREEQLRDTAVKKRRMLDTETTATLTAQAREMCMEVEGLTLQSHMISI